MKETIDFREKKKKFAAEINELNEDYVREAVVNELEQALIKLTRLKMRMKSSDIYLYAWKIEATATEHGVSDSILEVGLTNLVELLVRHGYYVEAKLIAKRYRLTQR